MSMANNLFLHLHLFSVLANSSGYHLSLAESPYQTTASLRRPGQLGGGSLSLNPLGSPATAAAAAAGTAAEGRFNTAVVAGGGVNGGGVGGPVEVQIMQQVRRVRCIF